MGVGLYVTLVRTANIKPHHYLNSAKTSVETHGGSDIYAPNEVKGITTLMILDRPYVVMDVLKELIVKHLDLDGTHLGTDCSDVGYLFNKKMVTELISLRDSMLSTETSDYRKKEIIKLIEKCGVLITLKDIEEYSFVFTS